METANITTKEGCPRHCGNVTIPYPFGIGNTNSTGCSLNPSYDVFCNLSFNPPKPFLSFLIGEEEERKEDMVEIIDISETHIRIRNRVAFRCFNSSGQVNTSTADDSYVMSLTPGSPFGFSTLNKFVTIGCHEFGFLSRAEDDGVFGTTSNSCKSMCSSRDEVEEGRCNGFGCCQAAVPKRSRSIDVILGGDSNNTNVTSFNPCGYAFLAEEDRFVFHGLSDLNDPSFVKRVIDTIPVAIDWVIANGTCAEARINPSNYACMGNTTCSDHFESGAVGGYKCSCAAGFEGHPYLSPGCLDIDECVNPNLTNCSVACVNTVGSFQCPCPSKYTGDGRKNGTGCRKKSSENLVLKLGLGISSGFLFLAICSSWLYIMDQKRRAIKMSKKFFEQNGGWLLKEQLSTAISAGNTEPTKIFNEEELKVATNNFDKHNILGNGGYGTVYKGVLANNRVVAIKKSKMVDQEQIEQFINEVVILGQINHRNVVKLLGCCLETEVPLLVYEYISKGTLCSHIHESRDEGERDWVLTWSDCVRIASEAADALAYLHSAASPPIIHRDIKSMNILLDDDYTTKIADFGASRLIPKDQSQLSTLVKGTLGYLDPEYFHSNLLTEKSDVYSFGVLLAELMTRQKPLSPFRSENDRNLAIYFVRSVEQETLFDILDPQWVNEATILELVSMASIAQKCLKMCGEDRPTMSEVSMELQAIKKLKKQSKENQIHEESETTISLDKEEDLYPVPR